MNQVFLYTFPQWIVFAALFVIVYGWVEQKKVFRLTGEAMFILLGIFALIVLLGDFLAAGNFLTPEEVVAEELNDEILNEVPIEAKLFPAYLGFLIAGIMAIPTFLLEWKNHKRASTLVVITSVVALLGFFIIVGALRMV
ncbi:hypothetical protein [Maribellus sediminis]|uniref:hypothetical protein n=1 Tax=Maribellus sediminis TaxID=2696285 RepID=UPI001431E3AE|nr:hypothetical protein [Maribellus sediminis]